MLKWDEANLQRRNDLRAWLIASLQYGGLVTAILYGLGWAFLTIVYSNFGISPSDVGFDFNSIATRAVGAAIVVVALSVVILVIPLTRGSAPPVMSIFGVCLGLVLGADLCLIFLHEVELLSAAISGAIMIAVVGGLTRFLRWNSSVVLAVLGAVAILILPWAAAASTTEQIRSGDGTEIDLGLSLSLFEVRNVELRDQAGQLLPAIGEENCVTLLGKGSNSLYLYLPDSERTVSIPDQGLVVRMDPQC